MRTVTLKIQGMHCASCPIMIEGVLEDDVEGVKSAQANYQKRECVVDFDEGLVRIEDIIDAVEKIGYKVVESDATTG